MQRQLNINTSVSLKLMVYFNRCIFCNDDPLLTNFATRQW